mmetsp:Transcript_6314/g.8221  ORF Transcript_6314/g.8221 Transcript_6314/m.8221 type:complete len:216 (-) Transcript_6314:1710-2357(-)
MMFPEIIARPFAVFILSTTLSADINIHLPTQTQQPVPILEVIKVYGKLAGPQCYGKTASKGSSCQITLEDFESNFQLNDDRPKTSLTREDFGNRLSELDFQWPLKPYGIDSSLAKTVGMNKGAETKVFMDQLESRGLYDRRNPAGPLPTSLRPQLNSLLNKEGVDSITVDRVYDALRGDGTRELEISRIRDLFGANMDYYGFLNLVGSNSITWPY